MELVEGKAAHVRLVDVSERTKACTSIAEADPEGTEVRLDEVG